MFKKVKPEDLKKGDVIYVEGKIHTELVTVECKDGDKVYLMEHRGKYTTLQSVKEMTTKDQVIYLIKENHETRD